MPTFTARSRPSSTSPRPGPDGPLVLAGGITDGASLRAALTLGVDLAYLGTRFLATAESLAAPEHKQMITATTLDDIVQTAALTGLPANMLTPSFHNLGLDPAVLHDPAADLTEMFAQVGTVSPWRNLYSAGHSVSGIHDIPTVAQLVERLHKDFHDTTEIR
ncbi:NAD(P)H-dependent flavin oxidoreductase [Nocardia nepalensis]|uniref:NAD(P)H-dependent flavin oxidoreductase n=1 Tax=Nocardia nepalensis TaxID=3375448 RepID=UPI003B66D2FE